MLEKVKFFISLLFQASLLPSNGQFGILQVITKQISCRDTKHSNQNLGEMQFRITRLPQLNDWKTTI